MIVDKGHIFNLMDTNGRRNDYLNALKIYLEILEELREMYPAEIWGKYPSSLSQFLFYKKAIEKSADIFKTHKPYNSFIDQLGDNYQAFIDRDAEWIKTNFENFKSILDQGIEKRARHYTSNLVKIGFSDSHRNITEVGYSYLRGSLVKDDLEKILPLDDVNIILLRQLLKLKVFGASIEGKRPYYSPFIMALVLLLNNETIDRHSFENIVQGLSPYCSDATKSSIRDGLMGIDELEKSTCDIDITVPNELIGKSDVDFETFKEIFKSSKDSMSTSAIYYDFFKELKTFRNNKTEKTYNGLLECLKKNSTFLYKAFGYGKAIFDIGNRGGKYGLSQFMAKNHDHQLLNSDDLLSTLYVTYKKSKWIDGIREYSDTTMRLLSATGLFKFKKLPELSHKEVLSLLFDVNQLRENIFGEMTDEEFANYEGNADSYFGKSCSLIEILQYTHDDVSRVIKSVEEFFEVEDTTDVKALLGSQRSKDFISHIEEKYPKEKIVKLLPLFSDRKKDDQIKKEVNESATVPTIYEYIIGIAWYYISNKEFDLYNSLNLTLNADFEPVIHAGGGEGDIVIYYKDVVVMLEVTLMNKLAQKRGEWEPVLRHSLNLKANNEPKETITFFVADELDYNTINIWRAVAAVSLESTSTHTKVDGAIIMPFTNKEILSFLEKDVYYKDIISVVKESFEKVPKIEDAKWHEDIVKSLHKSAVVSVVD